MSPNPVSFTVGPRFCYLLATFQFPPEDRIRMRIFSWDRIRNCFRFFMQDPNLLPFWDETEVASIWRRKFEPGFAYATIRFCVCFWAGFEPVSVRNRFVWACFCRMWPCLYLETGFEFSSFFYTPLGPAFWVRIFCLPFGYRTETCVRESSTFYLLTFVTFVHSKYLHCSNDLIVYSLLYHAIIVSYGARLYLSPSIYILILSLSQDSEHAADLDCLVFESEDGPGSGLGGGNFGGDGTGSSQLGEGVAGIVNEPRLGRIQLSVHPLCVFFCIHFGGNMHAGGTTPLQCCFQTVEDPRCLSRIRIVLWTSITDPSSRI